MNLDELKSSFDRYDVDSSGTINLKEFECMVCNDLKVPSKTFLGGVGFLACVGMLGSAPTQH